jgi:hypothetical protein
LDIDQHLARLLDELEQSSIEVGEALSVELRGCLLLHVSGQIILVFLLFHKFASFKVYIIMVDGSFSLSHALSGDPVGLELSEKFFLFFCYVDVSVLQRVHLNIDVS